MYKHILIATDGSELAGKGVDAGLALAQALAAKVILVTASEPWPVAMPGDPVAMATSAELQDRHRKAMRAEADVLLGNVRARASSAGVMLDAVFVPERAPADAILEVAAERGADLIVMASHGRTGLRKLLLGSQAQAVLGRSTLPVLVVR
ncbi:universal stress protein [Luteimonas aestuarii]|uniref:Universal stress protein n=1 Tax=Luteimonas aestuarii TaxID=453837 RepID=A0A4R5U0Q8_9GAMM|nr:universal stress protein [Luteimonas aestuarii]TDK27139.1 universal stress protein [Luteimonas aestuarii]